MCSLLGSDIIDTLIAKGYTVLSFRPESQCDGNVDQSQNILPVEIFELFCDW